MDWGPRCIRREKSSKYLCRTDISGLSHKSIFFQGKQEEVNGGSQHYFEKLWKTVTNDPIFQTMKKLDTTSFRTEASPWSWERWCNRLLNGSLWALRKKAKLAGDQHSFIWSNNVSHHISFTDKSFEWDRATKSFRNGIY